MDLPPCGLYATRAPIGTIPAGRLVYFHNHGNPGAGMYLPVRWKGNRARFEARGHLLPEPAAVQHLEPLAPEGFYRVRESFHCCEKRCREFETDLLVQLGYDGAARAILFLPEVVDGQMAIPSHGTRVDRERLSALARLTIPVIDSPLHEGDIQDETLLH